MTREEELDMLTDEYSDSVNNPDYKGRSIEAILDDIKTVTNELLQTDD